uniref:Uncharacterized protein n=1 Tax=Glossina austeni TaxID=7395 RepID=A0A1A9VAB2_GLOAU
MDRWKLFRIIVMTITAIVLLPVSYIHWRNNQRAVAMQQHFLEEIGRNISRSNNTGMPPFDREPIQLRYEGQPEGVLMAENPGKLI